MAHKQRILPTQQRAVQMRRALLDAALHLLGERGAAGLTTTAIVERAHVSTGTFYRYFNDKAEIVTALRDEAVAAVDRDLREAVVRALDLDLPDAVREIVSTLVAGFEEHGPVVLAVVDAQPGGINANVLPEIERDLFHLAAVIPRRHLPGVPPERLEALVFMTMGVVVATSLRIALFRPPGSDREALVDVATSMLVAGLRS